MATISDPHTRGKTFDLGGPTQYTQKQFAEKLLELLLLTDDQTVKEVPDFLLSAYGSINENLRNPRFTKDQVRYLCEDNVVSEENDGFRRLNLPVPSAVEKQALMFIRSYRPPIFTNFIVDEEEQLDKRAHGEMTRVPVRMRD